MQKIKILSVIVEGTERLAPEDIIRSSRLYEGREVDFEDIQKSIKTLWSLNQFNDIQVFVDEESDDGVHLRIVVVELPILES
ncbi:MAG: POTRA domain-containing protein, partial [Fidelibacterota bacterium]